MKEIPFLALENFMKYNEKNIYIPFQAGSHGENSLEFLPNKGLEFFSRILRDCLLINIFEKAKLEK